MSPETRAKIAAARKAAWQDPIKRQNTVTAQKAGCLDAWGDPERKAARLEKCRTTLEAKKTTGVVPVTRTDSLELGTTGVAEAVLRDTPIDEDDAFGF
jgi:hypothetical protein